MAEQLYVSDNLVAVVQGYKIKGWYNKDKKEIPGPEAWVNYPGDCLEICLKVKRQRGGK